MRVSSIGLYTGDLEVANFGFSEFDPTKPYLARAIIGLDADEIIPKFYGFGISVDQKLYSFALRKRDIVMRILLNPNRAINQSFSDLRDDLLRAISATRNGEVELRVFSGVSARAKIRGFITKFEAPYFSKTPEVQITMSCNDPLFRGLNTVQIKEEDSVTGSNPLVVSYSMSTAPHGLSMELQCDAASPDLTIQDFTLADQEPGWAFQIVPGVIGAGTGFLVGDKIIINSETNRKAVTLVRGTQNYALGGKVAKDSAWPVMFPGINKYLINKAAPDAFSLLSLEYTPAYWGV